MSQYHQLNRKCFNLEWTDVSDAVSLQAYVYAELILLTMINNV